VPTLRVGERGNFTSKRMDARTATSFQLENAAVIAALNPTGFPNLVAVKADNQRMPPSIEFRGRRKHLLGTASLQVDPKSISLLGPKTRQDCNN
jgi:hypothetical protein